jgi:hypothetical protein
MVIQKMTDFEGFVLFLALLLLILSIMFTYRWASGKVNDAVGIFAICGIVTSLAIPIIVLPGGYRESVRAVVGLTKDVSKELGISAGEGVHESFKRSIWGKNANRTWYQWATFQEPGEGGGRLRRR